MELGDCHAPELLPLSPASASWNWYYVSRVFHVTYGKPSQRTSDLPESGLYPNEGEKGSELAWQSRPYSDGEWSGRVFPRVPLIAGIRTAGRTDKLNTLNANICPEHGRCWTLLPAPQHAEHCSRHLNSKTAFMRWRPRHSYSISCGARKKPCYSIGPSRHCTWMCSHTHLEYWHVAKREQHTLLYFSSVSVVSDYGMDDWAFEVRSPAGAEDFSSSLCVQTSSGAHPASCTEDAGGPFLGLKCGRGRDADHSPQSSAEVRNE
jgi:hypothetical protein